MEFEIEKCAMQIMNSAEREITVKLRKYQNNWRKEKLQELKNIRSGHH